jgi:hypothetical protein
VEQLPEGCEPAAPAPFADYTHDVRKAFGQLKIKERDLLWLTDVVGWVRFLREKERAEIVFGLGHSLGASNLIHGLALGADLARVVADSTGAN